MENYILSGHIPDNSVVAEFYKPMADRCKSYLRIALPVLETYMNTLVFKYKPLYLYHKLLDKLSFGKLYNGYYNDSNRNAWLWYMEPRAKLYGKASPQKFSKLMDSLLTGYNNELEKYLQDKAVPLSENGAFHAIASFFNFS